MSTEEIIQERLDRLYRECPIEARMPLQDVLAETEADAEEDQPKPAPKVSPKQREFLMGIHTNPTEGISDRYRRSHLSPSKGRKIKAELISAGLIKELSFSTGKRGGDLKLLDLTPKALRLLGIGLENRRGQGSFLHKYFQESIAGYLNREGRHGYIEMTLNGKAADVGVTEEDGIVAYEIGLMAADGEAENAIKDLAAGFHRVVVAVREKKMVERIKRRLCRGLNKEQMVRIHFQLLIQYL